MNWKKVLTDKFEGQIIDVQKTNEDGITFLDITVSSKDLNSVDKLTKQINDFIDQLEANIDFDSLLVHSPGFTLDYKTDELEKHIGEKLDIKLFKSLNKFDFYTGELLADNEKSILIKWNCKGQFRNLEIDKQNIKSVSMNLDYASKIR
ncbi:LSm family protein [Mycoplasmopsis primatum]|uniref:hypothetical protein n=1 Tax=Mycoplasmopsis primatum TaxID=55604 RepID=UPI0004959DEF|nr:hypothetical protein [Mycoplasmopsis primatum]